MSEPIRIKAGLRNVKVNRNYILLIAAIFAAELGYGIVIPALQLYSTKVLGATVGLVGVAIAAFPFTNTFLKIFGGSLSDRFGRRLMIIIGLTISCLSPLLLSLINVSWLIWLYIPIRAMDGTGNSVIWPAANAMVADMMGRKRRDAAL
ncbi:MAG: MFS transporter, partial [bacterium]|nr:MFS transporter [bacterium]